MWMKMLSCFEAFLKIKFFELQNNCLVLSKFFLFENKYKMLHRLVMTFSLIFAQLRDFAPPHSNLAPGAKI